MTQKQLAALADMAQPRISAMERPGETKFNIDTLVRLASAFKVALRVEFVPFSEMLAWENGFSQDRFDVLKLDNDIQFLAPVFEVAAVPSGFRILPSPGNANGRDINDSPFQGLAGEISKQSAESNFIFPNLAQQGGASAYGTGLSNPR